MFWCCNDILVLLCGLYALYTDLFIDIFVLHCFRCLSLDIISIDVSLCFYVKLHVVHNLSACYFEHLLQSTVGQLYMVHEILLPISRK